MTLFSDPRGTGLDHVIALRTMGIVIDKYRHTSSSGSWESYCTSRHSNGYGLERYHKFR